MGSIRIQTGAVEPITVSVLDSSGNNLTGLVDLFIRLRRFSDGFFFDFSDSNFKASPITLESAALSEISATDAPGLYELSGGLDFSSFNNSVVDDTYSIIPIQTPGTNAILPGPGEVREGQFVDDIDAPISGVPDVVWDEDIVAAHSTADTAGLLLRAVGALISQRSNNATLNALLGVSDSPSADVPQQVTDEVWDELAATHVAVGSMGERMARLDVDASSRAAPGDAMTLTSGERDAISDVVWDEAAAGHVAGGSMGELQNRIDQTLSATESAIRGGDSRDLTEMAGSGFVSATDSLTAIRTALCDLTAAEVAAAVWDRDITLHTTADSAGVQIQKLDSVASLPPSSAVVGSILDRLANKDGSRTYDQTTDSLEGMRDRIG